MKNIGAFGYIVIAFIFIIILKIYWESDMFQLKCVISEVDGNKYCVRERAKLMLAADMWLRNSIPPPFVKYCLQANLQLIPKIKARSWHSVSQPQKRATN